MEEQNERTERGFLLWEVDFWLSGTKGWQHAVVHFAFAEWKVAESPIVFNALQTETIFVEFWNSIMMVNNFDVL